MCYHGSLCAHVHANQPRYILAINFRIDLCVPRRFLPAVHRVAHSYLTCTVFSMVKLFPNRSTFARWNVQDRFITTDFYLRWQSWIWREIWREISKKFREIGDKLSYLISSYEETVQQWIWARFETWSFYLRNFLDLNWISQKSLRTPLAYSNKWESKDTGFPRKNCKSKRVWKRWKIFPATKFTMDLKIEGSPFQRLSETCCEISFYQIIELWARLEGDLTKFWNFFNDFFNDLTLKMADDRGGLRVVQISRRCVWNILGKRGNWIGKKKRIVRISWQNLVANCAR